MGAAILLGAPMNPRREFLCRLFQLLDAGGVPWCILRNYGELLTNSGTDLDLLVAPAARAQFETLLARAAGDTGYRLVQFVERACYSRVYRHPDAGFFRVDYYTELRWRVVPILPTEAVLAMRRRPEPAEAPGLEGAFVPAAVHESVLLWMEVLWRGCLSERYCVRFMELRARCGDATALRAALRAAYGRAGEALAEFQARLPESRFDSALCARARRVLMLRALHSGWRFGALLRNVLLDARRLIRRLRHPAGATLAYYSAAARPRDFAELRRRLDFVFPSDRWIIRPIRTDAAGRPLWSWRTRLQCWRTLFQGGLFVALCQAQEQAASAAGRPEAGSGWFRSRRFTCVETAAGEVFSVHSSTGLTAGSPAGGFPNEAAWAAWLADFMATALEREALARGQ